jgi:hypothetical protein
MARTLTVSRVTVSTGAEPEYVATVTELARLSEARGRHLWLFRSQRRGGAFLECSESRTGDTHRAVAVPREDERKLERRLRDLATYAPEAWEIWEEVAL